MILSKIEGSLHAAGVRCSVWFGVLALPAGPVRLPRDASDELTGERVPQVVNVAQRGGMCAVMIGRPPSRLIGPEGQLAS
jgi:hypothetical protein